MRLGAAVLLSLGIAGCTSTVDPGQDFQIAEVVFDEGFYYCRVEPVLFTNGCGPGEPGDGNGCHFNVTSFRLTDYSPLVADSCGGGVVPGTGVPASAQGNYQSAQIQMRRDPDSAPLLNRPTGNASHPRTIFDASSPDADVIRQWATQFSSQ